MPRESRRRAPLWVEPVCLVVGLLVVVAMLQIKDTWVVTAVMVVLLAFLPVLWGAALWRFLSAKEAA